MLREKTLVSMIIVQAVLAGFSTILLFGLNALYDPSSIAASPTGSVGFEANSERGFAVYLEENSRLTAEEEALYQDFLSGELVAWISERETNGTAYLQVYVPRGEIQGGIVLAELQDLLVGYQDERRAQNAATFGFDYVQLDRSVQPDQPFGFVFGTLLPLLVLTPVLLSGSIASDSMMQERRTRTLQLLRQAPLTPGQIVLGKLLLPVVLAPLQILLWMGLLAWNGFLVGWPVLLVGLVLALLLSSLGLLVGVVSKDEATTQVRYAALLLVLLYGASYLPQDPLNLIARFGSGVANEASWLSLGFVALASIFLLGSTLAYAKRRIGGEFDAM